MDSAGVPPANDTSLSGLLNSASGTAAQKSGQTVTNFLASLGTERERTKPPPDGFLQWLLPVFKTSNSDFISKCGLDAYFFLRYLRTLLKIFVPLAFLILPILIPLNVVHGRGSSFAIGKYAHNDTVYNNVTGLDLLAWGNVRPESNNRYWVHLVLAVVVVIYTCFVFFDELRGYIRLRQSYLTSPQHRLRASATTVLVTAIPRKWCTHEALDGLYDVFPGGIRNIWVNRNFDELNEKVKLRNKLATKLESAMTGLIRKAKKAHLTKLKRDAKKAPKIEAREKVAHETQAADRNGKDLAMRGGISAGDPHQTRHTLDEALDESSTSGSRAPSQEHHKTRFLPIPVVGPGVEVVGHGIDTLGKTFFRGLKQAERDVDARLTMQGGLVLDDGEESLNRKQLTGPDHGPSRTGGREDTFVHLDGDGSVDYRKDHQSLSNYSNTHDQHLVAPQPYEYPPETAHSPQSFRNASMDSRVDGATERRDEAQDGKSHNPMSHLKFWKQGRNVPFGIPSPTPHGFEEDEFPLGSRSPVTPGGNPPATVNGNDGRMAPRATRSGLKSRIPFFGSSGKDEKPAEGLYPAAYNEEYDPEDGEPLWKKFLQSSDRDSMRLPIYGWRWMPTMPFVGPKVDTIDYCRREVARLNVEIEQDQKEPEKFPLMNSAFIQFNHQVAAHMACQAISHHTPQQMTPRIVEISPDDVIWDNMSVKWWENYLRTAAVILLIAGLILGWAVPVGFTAILGNLDSISHQLSWLRWVQKLPRSVLGIISGVLPQALLAGLLALLPVMLRLLARTQGSHTGMAVELAVQEYYFSFLFVQVFLVVSISSSFTNTITQLSANPTNIPSVLAQNLPRSTNFFFQYMLLQALTVSAGALVQIGSLIQWFILAPIMDSTGRQKWKRQTTLSSINWGTFFPVYTNLAAIGLIYSVISPLIMLFNIVTFSLFWLVYRYNTLYVTKFRFDTGGLLFPRAINQLFTGLYVMELCLIGLFFLVRDADANGNSVGTPCKGQAIIMIVVLILTVLYQFLLNSAFGPLFRYLPITLEDEAVMRDEEFARAQEKRWRLADGEREGDDINDVLEERERRSLEESRQAEAIELREIEARRERSHSRIEPRNFDGLIPDAFTRIMPSPKKGAWAERSRNQAHSRGSVMPQANNMLSPEHAHDGHRHRHQSTNPTDIEAQRSGTKIGEALFSGLNDEIEDLTPEERDKLVQRAFQHSALRARRPVIWIPRDDLGVSDDEVLRTQKFSEHIWISNEFIGLDGKCRVIYRKSPPDFSEVDLIEL
ncbi:MAG: hypothetical protein LQ346_003039 [Caloplaca aetnensis]|nr:MAG: hypothetical protein LQ346_003039 [Caloplaca aetnensis]